MHDISSDEEPLISSGRTWSPGCRVQSLRGTFPVHRMSSPQSPGTPGTFVEAGSAGCTLVDPPDSLVPCDSDHEEVSVFDNLMDSDEELEFEENLRRSNSSTVPGVPLQNRFSPLVESPNVRETVIDEGSENLHVSSEDELHARPNSGRQVVPRIDRTLQSVADNLPKDFTTDFGQTDFGQSKGFSCMCRFLFWGVNCLGFLKLFVQVVF